MSPAWALDLAGFGSYSTTTDIGDAWGLGAKLDVALGQLVFLEGRASYYPEFTESVFDEELKISAFPLELGLGVTVSNFFASAGLTYFFLDPDEGEMDDSAGFYLSAGFKTGQPAGGFGVYGDVMYRVLTSTVNVGDAITVSEKDVNLDGIGINLGIVFRF
jgi:hypothetical protein